MTHVVQAFTDRLVIVVDRIERVILVGDLGKEPLNEPPTPDQFAKLPTVGRSSEIALRQWISGQALPANLKGVTVEVLRCGSSAGPASPTP